MSNARWENYLKYGYAVLDPNRAVVSPPSQSVQQNPQAPVQQPVRRGGCCGRPR